MISVVIVDDQVMIRMAVKGILESAGDIEVIGEADRAAEAIEIVKRQKPAVVVMDPRMPGMDGVEAIWAIVAEPSLSSTRILVLTTFEGDQDVMAALRAGAHGYLGKAAEPADLIRSVQDVAHGKAMLSPSATQSVIVYIAGRSGDGGRSASTQLATPQQIRSLTPREREIIRLVAKGMDNETIAEQLFISPFTVKTHVNRTMQKLGVRGRAQLVRVAYEHGLVN